MSLTYDTRLTPNLEFGAGLSYMFWGENHIRTGAAIDSNGNYLGHYSFWVSNGFYTLRSDDALHLTAFARVSVPLNEYVELGFRAGLHLSIIGIESVMFLPGLRVRL